MKNKYRLANPDTMFWGFDDGVEIKIINDQIVSLEQTPFVEKKVEKGIFVKVKNEKSN